MNSKKASLFSLKNILLLVVALLLLAIVLLWNPIKAIYLNGVPQDIETKYVHIHTGANFAQVMYSLTPHHLLKDP